MTRRVLGLTGLSTLLLAGLTACPGDDTSGTGTETDTDGSTTMTTSSTTSSTTDDPSTSTTTTTDPSTSTTTTTTTDPDTGSTTTGDTDTDTEGETDTETGELPCPYTPVEGATSVNLETVATGFGFPLQVVGHPIDNDDLYVVERGGTIRILGAGENTPPAEAWLDINVGTTFEQGMYSMAFHPDFANTPMVYVSYADAGSGATAVDEFEVAADGSVMMESRRRVIAVGQFAANHNGGQIAFGPDDYLYMSPGDGGEGNDLCQNGQRNDTLLGSMIRIDPAGDGNADQSTPACDPVASPGDCGCGGEDNLDYSIPDDNPFVGVDGADEIFATGVRNPWRFSFDPINGDLYIADVGQGAREEVTILELGDNGGWNDMEGFNCFGDGNCDTAAAAGTVNADGLRMPITDYDHMGGRCSITGLGNYRSCESPAFDGLYFYGDLCSREIYAVGWDGTTATEVDVGTVGSDLVGGGYNAYGDVYLTLQNGEILRVAPGK